MSDFMLQFVPGEPSERAMSYLPNPTRPTPRPAGLDTTPVGDVSHKGGLSGFAANGALLGFGDEYLAGLSAVLGVQPDQQGGANWFDYSKPIGERYGTALDQIRDEMDVYEADNPGKALTAEVAGALAIPAGSLKAGGTLGQQAARGAAVGAGTGATYGFGDERDGFDNRLQGATQGAAMGAVVGGAAGAAIPAATRAVGRRAERALGKRIAKAAPAVDTVLEEGQQAYRDIGARGLSIKPEPFADLVAEVETYLMNEGAIAAGKQSAAANNALRSMVKQVKDGRPVTLKMLDAFRGTAATSSNTAGDNALRHAEGVRGLIDGFVFRLVDDDVISGSTKSLSKDLTRARDLWARMKQSSEILEAIDKAADVASGFENGLRIEFRKLLKNKRLMKSLPKGASAAVREVVQGSVLGNTLKRVSKIGWGAGQQTNALGGGLSSALAGSVGFATGGPVGAVVGAAVPAAIGGGAGAASSRITRLAAERSAALAAAGRNAIAPANRLTTMAAPLNRANALRVAPVAAVPAQNKLLER